MDLLCAHCRKPHNQTIGQINRAAKAGLRLFCNKRCFGLDRRKHKTKAQKVEEKRLYDIEYREKNKEMLKSKKAKYFQRTYDPKRAAKERKKRMHLHILYCQQPKYKAWKHDYDRIYLAKKQYGAYWESALTIREIEDEVQARISKYDIRIINGTYNKVQFRRRQYESQQQTSAIRR